MDLVAKFATTETESLRDLMTEIDEWILTYDNIRISIVRTH